MGQQDKLAVAYGDIALGLIQVYKALGGGWQIRCAPADVVQEAPMPAPSAQPKPNADARMAPPMGNAAPRAASSDASPGRVASR